jgi:uncharacterized RDD family membrane protein YckC
MAPAGPAPGLGYAGFWIRFAAHLIDSILLGIPIGIVAVIVIGRSVNAFSCGYVTGTDGFSSYQCTGLNSLSSALLLPQLMSLVLSAVYFVVLWSWQGQTLGQKILGLHVVDAATGQKIGVGRAIGRYVGYVISAWVLFIGLIWAAFDQRKQGWHDKMASTFVVRRI